MLVNRAECFPAECVVRGYLSGSGWKATRAPDRFCGIALRRVYANRSACRKPIFTPANQEHERGA